MNITNEHYIDDSKEREQVLSSLHSFIVQAPAGSGKTELLVQRFLFLLGTATQAPQEILAITFTKKAAEEMRQRIITALEYAQNNNEPPIEAHKIKTWQLAKMVLQQDKTLQWNLMHNLHTINIMTFDSFFYKIANRAPILSGLGLISDISQNPQECYRAAAQNVLQSLESNSYWQVHLKTLLIHLNNDFNSLENLFCDILAKRDQWLPFLPMGDSKNQSKRILESNLAAYLHDLIDECDKQLPPETKAQLFTLYEQEQNTNNLINKWQWLANLLLTEAGDWRKRFPSNHFNYSNNETKECFNQIINDISDYESAKYYLQKIKEFPEPHYSEQQWKIINALIVLLPVLYTELRLIFANKNVVDYTEVALSALNAIGTHEEPTSLTLYFDHHIKHILIDEFQDTSITQYHFLEQLTSGWQPNDGRTLFLVGDPMQSIYRFRQAEVGLFIKTQKYGIGAIKLQYINLKANFRSTKTIINWINHSFNHIFPKYDQINSGAIRFSPSYTQKENENSEVIMQCFHHDSSQLANYIFNEISSADAEQSIAILVRNRSHLLEIIQQLSRKNIPFNAPEINALDNFTVVQDLLCLTRILLHTEDRIAWLAFLRSPWCGLTLEEIYTLANQNPEKSIWNNLKNNSLSHASQERLKYVIYTIEQAFNSQLTLPLAEWVESTWLLLQGEKLLRDHNEALATTKFFDILARFDYETLLMEFKLLEESVAKSYIDYRSATDAKVEIMTMHKAKGLEFDIVFLPHLEKTTQHDAHQLLLWHDHLDESDHYQLIIAPIKSSFAKEDPTYQLLRDLNKEKNSNELIRLFYVAATRAKSKLYLLSELKQKENEEIENPIKGSLLHLLWPQYQEQLTNSLSQTTNLISTNNETPDTEHLLRRIKTYPTIDVIPTVPAIPSDPVISAKAEIHLSKASSSASTMDETTLYEDENA